MDTTDYQHSTRAASYSRYSSQSQDERSIPDQQRKCRDRALRELNPISPDLEFYDEAVSGAMHERAGFDALMTAARAGRIDVVYFENLSRLARDCVLTLQTLRELVYAHKIRIVSLDEGLDSATSDSWELLAAVLGIQNEQFLRSLAKFVFRGQESIVISGLCVGDYCFGVKSEAIPGSEGNRRGRHAKPNKRYIIEAVEAAWVKLIFHWYAIEMRSLRWIANELTVRGAPKDHRATTKAWHHQSLNALLKNPKYIGCWRWGKKKNVRDYSTGKVRQEDRPAAEADQWTRQFPELRIIDDETFAKAQQRLQESAEAVALHRSKRKDGRAKQELNGSTEAAAKTWPRHLLSCLVECAECHRKLYVGGGSGKYLFCHGHRLAVCSNGTSLQRHRAESMILEAITREILDDPALGEVIADAAFRAWEALEQQLPSELAATAQALADVELRVARLVDQCERDDVPEISVRLRQRREEREALRAKLDRLNDASHMQKSRPTREWVLAQLENLRDLLQGGGPAAAIALRKLVGGQILVTEMRTEGRKRFYLRGEMHIQFRELAAALGVNGNVEGQLGESLAKRITIDFREPDDYEALADAVKEEFDAGLTFKEIGEKHHCSAQLASRAFAHWHAQHDLPVPDARGLRRRLSGRRQVDMVLEARVMELWRQDLSIREIAEKVGRRRDVVCKVIAAWHASRGLVMPDGRARRREIRLRKGAQATDLKAI